MISLMEKSSSTNAMKDFYAQLSNIRELDNYALISSICVPLEQVKQCIMRQPWMFNIALKDIRNIVVFLLWKEYKIILHSNESYIEANDDTIYQRIRDKQSCPHEQLLVVLETAYYIEQISTIRHSMSIPDLWDMFPNYVRSLYEQKGLAFTVSRIFKLFRPLISD